LGNSTRIVEGAAQFHDIAFPKNPVKIVNRIPLESKIAGDSNLLGILIRNLVSNAALHAPGKTLTVLLEENTIVFENQTTRIIKKPSYDGTGIGLSIVERVCARIGFKLIRELKSDVFRVRIRFS
jgi:signal transduction histidine kinase